jgi:hypothetical protein
MIEFAQPTAANKGGNMSRRVMKEKRRRHLRQRAKPRLDHPSSIWSDLSRKWFRSAAG